MTNKLKIILTLKAFLFLTILAFGQSQQLDSCKCSTANNGTFIETLPQFFGGEAALKNYLQKLSTANSTKSVVRVDFIVNCKGLVCGLTFTVLSGKLRKEDLDKIKIYFEQMPTWTPGSSNGIAIDTPFSLKIVI